MKFLKLLLLSLIFALAASMTPAQVVIHEIAYHPASDLDGDEFLELYNVGGAPVDLDGWCFEGIELCFGPGDIAQAHSADEWCDVDQIGVCADVLERFARSLVP